MEYKNLLLTKEGEIAIVSINRPQALNAMNTEVLSEMSQMMSDLENDESINVIILTGSGEKAFVAGADIGAMSKLTPMEGREFGQRGQRVLAKIENLKKPVIVAINGFALGGGCEIAMACDIRIASDKARIGQPEVNLGIIPGFGGTQRLPRLVGIGKAKELIFTGDMIDANEALRIGLVDKVVPHDKLMEEAKKMAKNIAGKGQAAIRLAKSAINNGVNADLSTGCILEKEAFGVCFSTEDQKEGMKAFLEKRKPAFKGK